MLEVGVKAPDFELPDQNGKIHRLSDYTGKKVILYFYPKDNTAGCTGLWPAFKELLFVVLLLFKNTLYSIYFRYNND